MCPGIEGSIDLQMRGECEAGGRGFPATHGIPSTVNSGANAILRHPCPVEHVGVSLQALRVDQGLVTQTAFLR